MVEVIFVPEESLCANYDVNVKNQKRNTVRHANAAGPFLEEWRKTVDFRFSERETFVDLLTQSHGSLTRNADKALASWKIINGNIVKTNVLFCFGFFPWRTTSFVWNWIRVVERILQKNASFLRLIDAFPLKSTGSSWCFRFNDIVLCLILFDCGWHSKSSSIRLIHSASLILICEIAKSNDKLEHFSSWTNASRKREIQFERID